MSAVEQNDLARAVSKILIVQAIVSGAVAFVIVGAAIYLSLETEGAAKAAELLQSWGGVVIGFYFGTAYAQISNLVRATNGQPAVGNGTGTG